MAESSSDKYVYENKIAERFGGQIELELVVPTPPVIPAAEIEDSELLRAAVELAWKDNDNEGAAS